MKKPFDLQAFLSQKSTRRVVWWGRRPRPPEQRDEGSSDEDKTRDEATAADRSEIE